MTQHLVIIGCGGFGREVFSLVQALNDAETRWDVAGFADDCPAERDAVLVERLHSRILGTVDWLTDAGPQHAVIAVGSAAARSAIATRLAAAPVTWATLVHPDATVGLDVHLGAGTIVAAGARLSTNISGGRHVHVDQNATVGHDTTLGEFSRLNPQACISGNVTVGARATVGAGATVLPGLEVGAEAFVGAGAVVVKPVPPRTVVKGVPAR